MELKFYKEEGKWYIDIPWDGDKSELEMVMGADVLLDELDCFKWQFKLLTALQLLQSIY